MLSWAVRLALAVAAIIAGWFVARDAVNNEINKMVVLLLLIPGLVMLAAFCEALLKRARVRKSLMATQPAKAAGKSLQS